MKPYFCHRPNNKQIACCCPGHDGSEAVTKWVGTYRNRKSKRAASTVKRLQARSTRRTLKLIDRQVVVED